MQHQVLLFLIERERWRRYSHPGHGFHRFESPDLYPLRTLLKK